MAVAIPSPPEPLDPAYKPPASITRLPANAPIEEILRVIERDGGIILTGFASPDDLAAIDEDVEAHRQKKPFNECNGIPIIPKETFVLPGLVGKSDLVAQLCEHPVLEQLRSEILTEKFTNTREEVVEQHVVDPLLSISITLYIGYGAPRQRLHRDDNIHGIKHDRPFDLKKVSQFGCLIAGTKTTQQNGATMFVPGSHLWDDKRLPRTDEVCFAEMEPGSALIFLASCYHGGGHNRVKGVVRKVHGLFFIRGTLRQEENQFLAVPHSKVLTMSPKMLSLLGYKKPTTVLGIVENDDAVGHLPEIFDMVSQ